MQPDTDGDGEYVLTEDFKRIEKQRDELLAALEALIDMDVAYQRGRKVSDAVEAACAAIASVKGGA